MRHPTAQELAQYGSDLQKEIHDAVNFAVTYDDTSSLEARVAMCEATIVVLVKRLVHVEAMVEIARKEGR